MLITYLPGRGGHDRVRLYALFDVSSDWKLLRSDGRNLLPHRQTLKKNRQLKISTKSQMILLTLFTSMTIHMRLQRTRTSEPLVTDFALMLLLRARRDF